MDLGVLLLVLLLLHLEPTCASINFSLLTSRWAAVNSTAAQLGTGGAAVGGVVVVAAVVVASVVASRGVNK
jgi:uncharacterized integral membrane protein